MTIPMRFNFAMTWSCVNFEKLMVYSKSSAEKLRMMIQMEKAMKNIFSLLMKLIELTYQKYLVS